VSLSQRISQALSSIYREEFGVSVPEWRILANLAEKGELSPSEIASQTSMDRARVTRGIKDLRAKRCLLTRRDEGDKRAYRLRLSPAGEALYRQIVPLALAWERICSPALMQAAIANSCVRLTCSPSALTRLTDSPQATRSASGAVPGACHGQCSQRPFSSV
jgi:DNA-binding MarR family transcriptional regulator